MFNLVNCLTKEDNEKIEKYIELYGTAKDYIGNEKYLANWGKEKIKLYKLLDNNLVYKFNIKYEKTKDELRKCFRKMLDDNIEIDATFMEFFRYLRSTYDQIEINRLYWSLCSIISTDTLIEDKINFSFKIKKEGAKKEFQIQKGMKPMKCLSKMIEYFNEYPKYETLKKHYETLRLKHSMILNDKIIDAVCGISIHPMDFMTMSDNNSNWQSCMNWKNQGCYRIGTVEMMNSNNVVCCYIENKTPYTFDEESGMDWTNKRWRQLFYVTKDIIVSGKPYPFVNEDITKTFLEKIREMASKNLNWNYNFGPELYQDMKYINGSYSMNRAKDYVKYGSKYRHNIIFDSNGMYNDMVNDSDTKYWCVRNKIPHIRVINYSGKAPCLCCGNDVLAYYDSNDYNERYRNVSNVICGSCSQEYKCFFCDEVDATKKHYTYFDNDGKEKIICESCFKQWVKECPCCHKPFFNDEAYFSSKLFARLGKNYNEEEIKDIFFNYVTKQDTVKIMRGHSDCIKSLKFSKHEITESSSRRMYPRSEVYYIYEGAEDPSPYFNKNLKSIHPQDGLTITR